MFKAMLQDPLIQSVQSVLDPLSISDDTHTPKREGQRAASVLMPLVKRGEDWHVLLTRRPMHMSNHPGQISFPGGRTETGETPCEGALRETHEEVGIIPDDVQLLGRLPSFNAISEYRVTPFVGVFNPAAKMVAQPAEVEEIFEVPFAFVMNKNNHIRRDVEFEGEKHVLYDMPWPSAQNNTHNIWGMTAMIMHQLYHRLYKRMEK
ncbi:MAG: CoA pyrophosphatase [Robiginitomaculum sp.]|nr:MAG: CoA pyrophosphatase [Robiginitomaculum sp.]